MYHKYFNNYRYFIVYSKILEYNILIYQKGRDILKEKNSLSTLIKVTATVAGGMFLYNKVIGYLAENNSTLNNNENENYYLSKHGKIFYSKTGNGSPVLLVHDLSHLSCNKEWDRIIKHLSQNHTVYAIDLLGCGRSDKPAITYTNYMFVQIITDFINDVIQSPVDIIISGDATPIAITTGINNSKVLKKIILINPPSVSNSEIAPNNNTRMAKKILELPILGTFIYYLLNTKDKCFDIAINNLFLKDDYTSYTYSHTMYDAAHMGDGKSKYMMASLVGLFTNLSIRRPLVSLSNEILIIGGENEPHIEEIISSYRAVRPNIVSTIINSSKHYPQLENPKDLLSAINKHLD